MKQIALIGECMIELNGALFGALEQTYGGDSLNTATYLARLTPPDLAQVFYLSALGDDSLSREMQNRWQNDGIDTTFVLTDPSRQPGLYLVQLDSAGERSFLYWRNASAARYLLQHPQWSEIEAALPEMDMIYLSGISLAILPAPDRFHLIHCLIAYAASGGTLIFDGNYRPALWQSIAETRAAYAALLPYVQLALMTFDDEQALWGDGDIEDSIARLQRAGVSEIVIKCGVNGALYAKGNQRLDVATTPVSHVVDTTSAGDAFNAGFLRGYLAGEPAEISCHYGNHLAGIVIQYKGAIIPAHYCTLPGFSESEKDTYDC